MARLIFCFFFKEPTATTGPLMNALSTITTATVTADSVVLWNSRLHSCLPAKDARFAVTSNIHVNIASIPFRFTDQWPLSIASNASRTSAVTAAWTRKGNQRLLMKLVPRVIEKVFTQFLCDSIINICKANLHGIVGCLPRLPTHSHCRGLTGRRNFSNKCFFAISRITYLLDKGLSKWVEEEEREATANKQSL